jgi:hypothetical protein
MTETFTIAVAPDGSIKAIYDDRLAGLFAQGKATITRASFVEPDEHGQWFADLAPSGGPKLGPFRLRSEALSAEKEWLNEKLFGQTEAETPGALAAFPADETAPTNHLAPNLPRKVVKRFNRSVRQRLIARRQERKFKLERR